MRLWCLRWKTFAILDHVLEDGPMPGHTVTVREQLLAVLRGQEADRIPNVEFGYWALTLTTWHAQGLPEQVTTDAAAERHFGLDGITLFEELPVRNGLFPPFERTLLSRAGDREIIRDEEGNTCEVFTDTSSMPKYLHFGLATRQDWEHLRHERLDPDTQGRIGDVGGCLLRARETGRPAFFHAGALYGWLRNWMGVEGVSIALMADRAWVEEMMEHLTSLTLTMIERAVPAQGVDLGWWWEDMCYNRGPLISPRHFRELMVPRYRRITDALRKRGVDINVLDCDGRIHELAPGWLEAGIDCMFPLEVAHTNAFKLREELPSVLLLGGVDKRALIAGRDAIDAEIRRLRPLIDQGRYIPCVDHRVPPDVSYDNYRYYLDAKHRLLNP
jgi:Uroporphyrinogen decarboxylase (URO-D)